MSLNLRNKVVFITGASSGIGYATAIEFAKLGSKLILTARRKDRIDELAKKIKTEYGVEVLALEMDVTQRNSVESSIKGLSSEWSDISVLVNNAGLALDSTLIQEGVVDNWNTMIDTNVKGLLYVSRAILPGMIKRGSGHVLNVGSVSGHDCYQRGNVYCATKHAVTAISRSMRLDLAGTGIRVSDIAPGAVKTEFSEVRWKDKKAADEFYNSFDALLPEDVADGIVYAATRPLRVDVDTLIIYPTVQSSVYNIAKNS